MASFEEDLPIEDTEDETSAAGRRQAMRMTAEAFRNYLQAVNHLREGMRRREIEAPEAKWLQLLQSVRRYHDYRKRYEAYPALDDEVDLAVDLRTLEADIRKREAESGLESSPKLPYSATLRKQPSTVRTSTARLSAVYITIGSTKRKIFVGDRPR